MTILSTYFEKYRFKLNAFFIHLGISLLLVLSLTTAVLQLWYPYPYRDISSGLELIFIIIVIDILIGPLLTFITFNNKKSRREFFLDFGIIGVLQLSALIYGLWTAALARPVHIAFEYDRFRVVHASEIPTELQKKAPPELQKLPWTGPTYISLRSLTAEEKLDRTMMALGGIPLSAQADLWRPYQHGQRAILAASRPVLDLIKRFPIRQSEIRSVIEGTGQSFEKLAYIPLVSRNKIFWTVILNTEDAKVLAYLPLDSF